MRLLLDEHHHPDVAGQLRRAGYEATAIAERADRRGDDPEVLELAVSEHRALVTENVRDFVRLHRRRLERGEAHYVIVFTPAARYPRGAMGRGQLIGALTALLREHVAEDALRDRLMWP